MQTQVRSSVTAWHRGAIWIGTILLAVSQQLAAQPAGPPGTENCLTVGARRNATGVKFPEAGQVHLTLWSMGNFLDRPLGFGKWVGVVERDKQDNPGSSSTIFPGLQPGGSACLLFIAYNDLSTKKDVSAAFLLLANDSLPVKLPNSLICYHSLGNLSTDPPHIDANADHCGENSMVTTTVTASSGAPVVVKWKVTRAGLGAGFKTAIAALALTSKYTLLSPAEINHIAVAMDKQGPWFPCAATGCCRSY
jgi:hypothetical protein